MITMQGFWMGGESGGPYMGTGVSSVFPCTFIIAGTAPAFTTQPISATVTGGTVAIDAVATPGSGYQSMLNGTTAVAGATSPTLLLSDAGVSRGDLHLRRDQLLGDDHQQSSVTVSITSTNDIGRLTNISTRSQVGTGSNILIAGFTVGGAGTAGSESLLIRGSGPALGLFGVSGTLPDPQLQLYSGSTVLGTDNGWSGNASIADAAGSVGAFPWTNLTSKDSALLTTLSGGGYTAQISGEAGDTGVALAEVYDATPAGTYTPTSPRITNLSARVQVGTGSNILIAGFHIGGSTSRTVLIRASGPALVQFGVPGTLADPQLQVFSGSTVVAGNSVWGGDGQISETANSVGAFPWNISTSSDSAILVTLPPGSYTAQVSGVSGDTGVALVEIYEVP